LWSIIIAILFIGGIFGSLTLRAIADNYGRKKGLMLGFAGIVFSSAISMFSSTVS
jgi:MFS family permease